MESMDPKARVPIRAAQYVRISTEHQQYSTENQSVVIARYAPFCLRSRNALLLSVIQETALSLSVMQMRPHISYHA